MPRIDTAHHNIRVRTTVDLDDDVFEAARAPAEGSGRPLGAVLSHLVRWGLRCAPEFANRNGLPVFKGPPDAKIIPAGRASELLAG